MAQINDGLTFGLDQFKFNNQVLGYISEEGLAWRDLKPEKVKINATQVKSGPVKIIVKNNGTNVITFKLIQLDGPHCEAVMGGKTEANGTYTPPVAVNLEGPAEILCTSGHAIRISKGSLSAKLSGNINGSEVLAIECELEILASADGGAGYTICPPASSSAGA